MIPAPLARSLTLATLLVCLCHPTPMMAEPDKPAAQDDAPAQVLDSAGEITSQSATDTKPTEDAAPTASPPEQGSEVGAEPPTSVTEAPKPPETAEDQSNDPDAKPIPATPSPINKKDSETASHEQAPDEAQSQPAAADAPTSTSTEDVAESEKAPLRVASWGGAYGRSQRLAYADPFEAQTGTKIEMVDHGGRNAAIHKLGRPEAQRWDVVDLGSHMLSAACDAGHLEELDHAALLTADDEPAALDDFLPGALHKCGIASVAWSSVIAYDKRAFRKRKPKTARDFFDLKRFPGKRGLRNQAKFTLELALLADGVKAEDVYETLATEAGVDRAFAALDKLGDNIVWWSRGSEPPALIRDRKVAMTTAFNGRIFNSVVAENAPVAILWDGQIYDTDHWAIPKSAAKPDKARAFIAFALRPERLAAQAKWLPYGPMRKSALKKVAKHAEADVELAAFLPTIQSNLKTALKLNDAWWESQGSALVKRFEAWRATVAEKASEPDGG